MAVRLHLDNQPAHAGEAIDLIQGAIQQQGEVPHLAQIRFGGGASRGPDSSQDSRGDHMSPPRVGWNTQSCFGPHHRPDDTIGSPKQGLKPQMQLQIHRSDQPGWAIISPAGEIDLATVDQLEDALATAMSDADANVAVDLTGVTFMDSTGLRALLSANQKLAGSGHRLALIVSGGPVDRLLDISGVGQTLEIFQSFEAATA